MYFALNQASENALYNHVAFFNGFLHAQHCI